MKITLNRRDLVSLVNETIENILNEGRNEEKARLATIEVVKQHFDNAGWLDDVYDDAINTEDLTVAKFIEKSLREKFFHSNIPDAVIRLEPIIMKIALSFGFEQNGQDTKHLNRLAKITNFIKENYKKEGFPIQLNQLTIDNTSYDSLESIFGEYINKQIESDNEKANNKGENAVINPDYQILRIDSWEEAVKYGQFSCSKSVLCYIKHKNTWDFFYQKEENTVYLILNKNWKNIPEEHGKNTPYDEYGLSMIFLFIDPYGDIAYSNTRWNHETEGNGPSNVDQSFTKEDISNLLNVNFDSTFKPLYKPKDMQLTEKVEEKLREGISFNEIFNQIREFKEGLASVSLDGKWNFINKDGKLLSPEKWFDECNNFNEGFASVATDNGYNWIGKDGKLLVPGKWFEWTGTFYNGFSTVANEMGQNWMKRDGKLLIPGKWFDECQVFREGFAVVEKDDKCNWVDTNGNFLIPGEWFEWCGQFTNGFALIKTEDGYNWVDKKGNLLVPGKWFPYCYNFNYEGYSKFESGDKVYVIDSRGNVVKQLEESNFKWHITECKLRKITENIVRELFDFS